MECIGAVPVAPQQPGGHDLSKQHQQVIVRMPTDMHEAIKQQAEAQDLSMAQAIRAAVRQYLEPSRTLTA